MSFIQHPVSERREKKAQQGTEQLDCDPKGDKAKSYL